MAGPHRLGAVAEMGGMASGWSLIFSTTTGGDISGWFSWIDGKTSSPPRPWV